MIMDLILMKKISVITPAYNASKYIRDCAQSILSQTHINLEWIVVNDGSEDETLAILHEIENQDSRVKVFSQENGGAALARNLALNHISGEYFAFLDADDFCHPDFLKSLLKLIEDENADFVTCQFKDVMEDSSITDIHLADISDYSIGIYENMLDTLTDNYPVDRVIWNKLYRKKIFGDLRFKEYMIQAQDVVFGWECRSIARKIVSTSACYVFYRHSKTSISRQGTTKKSVMAVYNIAIALNDIFILSNNFKKNVEVFIKREIAKSVYKDFVKNKKRVKDAELLNLIEEKKDELLNKKICEFSYLPLRKRINTWFK